MYLKPLFLLAIFAFLYTSMRGEDIIVTSNADSGPGTLREAITKANSNGTTSPDNINFNIADVSISGRTIMLETSLPLLTSNIIIDGSTQPGSKIGVSDAKIRLTNTTTSSNIHGFHIINASNIEIYGIHFDNLGTSSLIGGVALEISNAENIITGAPGKGNYFSRLISAVTGGTFFINYLSRGTCVGFTFKSNIVNLTEDGNDVSYTQMYPLMLHNFFNVQIGV